MGNIKIRAGKIAIAMSLILAGCASAPAFTPSTPLDQSKSLEEALLLCNEYRLPVPAERPIVIRPYRDCVDRAGELHPPPSQSPYLVFRDELRFEYSYLHDPAWTPALGNELESAIHVLLRAIAGPQQQVTPIEKDLVIRLFPKTADALHAFQWPVLADAALDPKLEELKAGVRGMVMDESETRTEVAASGNQLDKAALCTRVIHLRHEADYLNRLWRDQYDMTRIAPRTQASASVRERYSRRLDAAIHELDELRPKVAEARANQGFRVLGCYMTSPGGAGARSNDAREH